MMPLSSSQGKKKSKKKSSRQHKQKRKQQEAEKNDNDDVETNSDNDPPPFILPPCIRSFGSPWKERKIAARTPQYLCTLVHPPPLERERKHTNGGRGDSYDDDNNNNSSSDNPFYGKMIYAGSAPCDPTFVFNGQYLVSATSDGRICTYALMTNYMDESFVVAPSQGETNYLHGKRDENTVNGNTSHDHSIRNKVVPPINISSLGRNSPIVAITSSPLGTTVIPYHRSNNHNSTPQGLLGHVVALTLDGYITVLEYIVRNIQQGSRRKKLQQQLKVDVVHSFYTGYYGASCLTLHHYNQIDAFSSSGVDTASSGLPTDTKQKQNLRICVGYESGLMTDWEIYVTYHKMRGNDSNSPPNKANAKLLWKGYFKSKINSISTLGSSLVSSPKELQKSISTIDEVPSHLAVCLVQSHQNHCTNTGSNMRPPLPSSIEVINIAAIEHEWTEEIETAKSVEGDGSGLNLADYCVWPEPGMEIRNMQFDSNRRHRKIRDISSRGTNRIYALNGTQSVFVAALSNGTFAFIDSFLKDLSTDREQDTKTLAWGVTQCENQLLFDYPCIGVGQLKCANDNKELSPHGKNVANSKYLACCLRGGTVYLIPEVKADCHSEMSTEKESKMEILVFTISLDDNPSSPLRFVQGFSASNANMYTRDNSGDLRVISDCMPVFVYSWGGTLDVYAAGTLGNTTVATSDVLRHLASNGVIRRLFLHLLSLDENNNLVKSNDLWLKAWIECQEEKSTLDADCLAYHLVQQPPRRYFHIRRLLLWLAQEEAA